MSHIVSTEEFKEKVLNSKGKVLVDFSAVWCGPCKIMEPIINQIEKEMAGKVAVYGVDVDELPDVAGAFRVMSIPTLIVFEDGVPVKQTLGAQPKANVLALLA